jgi:SAM-dependent methyltransferase
MALYNPQFPESICLPTGIRMDPNTSALFGGSLDAIGIRSRATILRSIATQYVNSRADTTWVSLGCGAAVPILDAVLDCNAAVGGRIVLTVADFDPSALAVVRKLATQRFLREKTNYNVINRNLARELIETDKIVRELGERSADFVESIGLFEYFDDPQCSDYLRNCVRLVRPGGALVVANMLTTHPELDFNQRGIGWPQIYPRSVESLQSLLVHAGIALSDVTMTVAGDGVYGVLQIGL